MTAQRGNDIVYWYNRGLRDGIWVTLAAVALVAALGALSLTIVGKAHAQDAALGDSIAVGTGRALGVQTYARVGASSCWVLAHTPTAHFQHLVISAGINDAPGRCVAAIRNAVHADHVVWILPAAINSARLHVAAIAAQHDDLMVSYNCLRGCSKRSFHPISYKELAHWVRIEWSLR